MLEEPPPAAAVKDPEPAQRDHYQMMIRCSLKACSRWYHPGCLRQPPFGTVVRDGRSGSFTCPAHTCLACATENPGTLPRPSPRYVWCLLCPAAYHPGEWCLPAGSKEVSACCHNHDGKLDPLTQTEGSLVAAPYTSSVLSTPISCFPIGLCARDMHLTRIPPRHCWLRWVFASRFRPPRCTPCSSRRTYRGVLSAPKVVASFAAKTARLRSTKSV